MGVQTRHDCHSVKESDIDIEKRFTAWVVAGSMFSCFSSTADWYWLRHATLDWRRKCRAELLPEKETLAEAIRKACRPQFRWTALRSDLDWHLSSKYDTKIKLWNEFWHDTSRLWNEFLFQLLIWNVNEYYGSFLLPEVECEFHCQLVELEW